MAHPTPLTLLPPEPALACVTLHGSGQIDARLSPAAAADLRARLVTAYQTGTTLPCTVQDPGQGTWYAFEAFVTTLTFTPALEVTLASVGPWRKGAAPVAAEEDDDG